MPVRDACSAGAAAVFLADVTAATELGAQQDRTSAYRLALARQTEYSTVDQSQYSAGEKRVECAPPQSAIPVARGAHLDYAPGVGWLTQGCLWVVVSTAAPACVKAERPMLPPPAADEGAPQSALATPALAESRAAARAYGEPQEPLLAISDATLLGRLEKRGFDIASTAGFGRSVLALPNNEELAKSAAYRSLTGTVSADIAEFMAKDALLGVGMNYSHRAFDSSWLSRPDFRFELAGIINRIDRRDFNTQTCGELRLIYRLSYAVRVRDQDIRSRVPMTVNVVRWLPKLGESCADEATRWVVDPKAPDPEGVLTSKQGPLFELEKRTSLKSVEINLQSVRWPSTIRPNMAGHAEYLMRVFVPNGDELEPALLENTPDVERLRADSNLRALFLSWLRAPGVLDAIDLGTAIVPDQFLAKRAISVAPHGLSRQANRPFTRTLEGDDAGPIAAGEYRTFLGATSLLRRLDGLSCPGCHQTRSIAGFHFLGEDDKQRRADIIAVPHSPHFGDELVRRTQYVTALAQGRVPNPQRLPTERMGGGEYGAHCGLKPSGEFGDWTCDEGLICVPLTDDEVGTCMPKEPGPGDVCEIGRMRSSGDRRRDYVSLQSPADCGSGHCEKNSVGFPGGMCSTDCRDLDSTVTCGGIAQLVGFNTCLAGRAPFEQCILDHSRPGALRACSLSAPCREDYICASTAAGQGACIPPYFLFQMRVDGHVLP